MLGLLLAACHESPNEQTTAATTASVKMPRIGPSADITRHQSSDVVAAAATTGTQATFTVLMNELPAQQRVLVRDWYERLGAPSTESATAAQTNWMRKQHYPMPSDIAHQASMSTAELKAAASTGRTGAQILYLARQLHNFGQHLAQGYGYTRRKISPLPDIITTMRQLLGSGSPFAGYLYAAKARTLSPGNEKAIASARLAGLIWASKFGDTRATRLLNDPKMQAVNAGTVAVEVSTMLDTALQVNPQLFTTPVTPIPPSHP